MSNERRKYPRVSLAGEVNIMMSEVIRSATLTNVSPSGIQLECHRKLVEQLNRYKNEAGLLPEFDVEFPLPGTDSVKACCSVSYCRRLSQDRYHLGMNFARLSHLDEARVDEFINHTVAA